MALALNNTIQYWRARIQHGPAGEFVRWWLGELRQLLPAKWQQRLQLATRRVVLQMDSGDIRLGVEEGGDIRALGEFPAGEDAGLQRQRILTVLEESELGEMPRFLVLDDTGVLRKELKLPAAAEANLRQVLTFEMDRQTPFRAADVYFDWRVLRGSKEAGDVHLELLVTPRAVVDNACEGLAARGLSVSGVDVVANGEVLGVNLLPPERRVTSVNPRTRLNYALAGAALVLLVLVMVQSLSLRASRVEDLEAAIEAVQDEARRVQGLREQVEETSEAASFLTRKRSLSPMAIEVLADVTRTLPDDTYLDRLVIGQDSVLMQGKSRNAQQLIEIVNKSDRLEEAAFRGSTRLDAATGLEIFEIGATVSARGGG
ncbi:PilN domain-containing protein [Elongatibacter sediminis]|uniref:PilN domain-containing protein n=1 Tax=Elongatibacter sediminis TaxID=3119006 RepID=A0AAW9RLQ8_9GAMM